MTNETVKMKKPTKRDKFSAILTLIADHPDLVEFVEHEIELLAAKKSTSKPTKTQEENAKIADIVCDILLDEGKHKVGTLIKHKAVLAVCPDCTSQKMTAIMRTLCEGGRVVRTKEKKDTFFSINESNDDLDVEVEVED